MPMGRRSPEFSSDSCWLLVVLCLSMELPRSEPKVEGEFPMASPLNKLGGALDLEFLGAAVHLLLHLRGGDKVEEAMAWSSSRSAAQGVMAASLEIHWSRSSAAHLRWQYVVQLLTQMAVRRPLRVLVSALGWCHLFCSLPARVPKGRVFFSSAAAFVACLSPSGVVPGDGAGGRSVELDAGGEGPDGIFQYRFRVFSVKVKDCAVIFISFGVLLVICKPTALK